MTTEMRMRLGFVACLMLAYSIVNANKDSVYTDSLRNDVADVELLHELAVTFVDNDNRRALAYLKQARTIAERRKDSVYLLRNLIATSQVLRRLESYDEALTLSYDILANPTFSKRRADLAIVYQTIGLVYLFKSQFDDALESFFEGLQVAEESEDEGLLMSFTSNIGLLYYRLSDYSRAVGFLEQALKMTQEDLDVRCGLLVDLSLCHLRLGEISAAGNYVQSMTETCTGVSCAVMMHIKYSQGLYNLKIAQYGQAKRHFFESLFLARNLSVRRMEIDNLFSIADAEIELGNFLEAKVMLDAADRLINEGTPFMKEVLMVYKRYIRLYEEMNDSEELAKYQRKYITLRDRVYSDSLTLSLMRLEASFVERENLKRIAMQEELLISKDEALRWQRVSSIGLFLLALLVVGFLLLIYRDLRRSRKTKDLLTRKVRERTRELQEQHVQMHNLMRERELFVDRTLRDIRGLVKQIEGLCKVAAIEPDDRNLKNHMERIVSHLSQLMVVASRREHRA